MPATSTLSPITAAFLGALMFDEQIRGGWAIPLEVVFAVVLVVGVVLLASSPLIDVATARTSWGLSPGPVW